MGIENTSLLSSGNEIWVLSVYATKYLIVIFYRAADLTLDFTTIQIIKASLPLIIGKPLKLVIYLGKFTGEILIQDFVTRLLLFEELKLFIFMEKQPIIF